MNTKDVQEILNANGFPCGPVDGIIGPVTNSRIVAFQRAYNAGAWLAVDGIVGPATSAALSQLPAISSHFSVKEVACRHCGVAFVRRELLAALEVTRGSNPLSIVDAYRCPVHNASVGGASDSMHLWGAAADIDDGRTPRTVQQAENLHVWSGIGNRGSLASHLDVRHLVPDKNRTPGATPSSPARWAY